MTKTSELPLAGALAGTEVLALVQGGTTKRILLSSVSTFVLGNVGTRLTAAETAIGTNATAIAAADAKASAAVQSAAANATAIASVSGRVGNTETAIGTLGTAIGQVSNRVTANEQGLTTLGAAHNALVASTTALAGRVGATETAATALTARVVTLEEGGTGGGGDPTLPPRVAALEAFGVDSAVFNPAKAYSAKATGDVNSQMSALFPGLGASVSLNFTRELLGTVIVTFPSTSSILDVFYLLQGSLPPGLLAYLDYDALDPTKIGLRFESPSNFSIAAGPGYSTSLNLEGQYTTSVTTERRLVRTNGVDHFGARLSDILNQLFGTDSDIYNRVITLENAVPKATTSVFVPGDHATGGAALNWIRQQGFRSGSKVDVYVAGGTYFEGFEFVDEDLSFVTIKGEVGPTFSVADGAYTVVSTSGGKQDVRFNVTLDGSIQVGDYVNVHLGPQVAASNEAYSRVLGYWPVVALGSGTLTVRIPAKVAFGNKGGDAEPFKISKHPTVFKPSGPFILGASSRIPRFEDVGVIGDGSAVSMAVSIDACELRFGDLPQWVDVAPRPRVSISNFGLGVVARKGSEIHAEMAISGCNGLEQLSGIWLFEDSSFVSSRCLIVSGNAGRGINVSHGSVLTCGSRASGSAAYAIGPARQHPTVVTGNGDIGLCVYNHSKATAEYANFTGNFSLNVYAGDVSTVSASASILYGVSPALNTEGNNKSYIRG